jgi:hypothetical protein
MARNRVIYQSEALFVNKQYSGGKTVDIVDHAWRMPAVGGNSLESGMFHQIHRVQSANYNFAINRTDVNQFGQLARIDTAVIEAPTVGLDFTYLVTDGTNEDKLGITVDPSNTETAANCGALSGLLANASGRNYHILTVKEGDDANIKDATAGSDPAATSTVISIGNGFITNYSVSAAVGSLPTASISVEGLNITAATAGAGLATPAIDPDAGTEGTATFTLPTPRTGEVGQILRPGDMTIKFLSDEGASASDPSLMSVLTDSSSANGAHIQNFSLDVPLGRSVIQRLGNAFGFAREVDFPVTVSMSVSAVVADLKAGILFDELYDTSKHTIAVLMNKPVAGGSSVGSDNGQIAYILRNCTLESESFSSSIGDNKSVDMTFTATVGGATDSVNGLFISGTQCGSDGAAGNPVPDNSFRIES